MRHVLFRVAIAAVPATAVPVFISTSASAVVECGLTSSPASPSATTGAFGQDVSIEATAHAACRDDGSPVVMNVCIAVRKELVSGSTSFANGTKTIPYTLIVNSVAVGDSDTQVFTGAIPSTGKDLPVTFLVRSEDYAGKAAGIYDATVTWTISYDPAICN